MEKKLDQIKQDLEELKLSIDRLRTPLEEEPYQSDKTEELNTALAAAVKEFPIIIVNRQNSYLASGYADLHHIMKSIRPILGNQGLTISHRKKPVDGAVLLTTRVWHSSGQWIESRVFLHPTKDTVDAYGSNLNYMKRFEVMDLLGLTISEDPFDDDGQADSELAKQIAESGVKTKKLYRKKKESFDCITGEQYEELMYELDDSEDIVEDLLDSLQIKSLREIPKSRFSPTINRVRKIKQIRKG